MDDDMNGNDRPVRDNRKWQVSKEISLPLIYSVVGVLVALGIGYESLRRDISDTTMENRRLTAALKETNTELRALTKQFQEGSVPSAENAWKIRMLESTDSKVEARISEVERQAQARELRVQRLENAINNTNARVRAQTER